MNSDCLFSAFMLYSSCILNETGGNGGDILPIVCASGLYGFQNAPLLEEEEGKGRNPVLYAHYMIIPFVLYSHVMMIRRMRGTEFLLNYYAFRREGT